MRKLLVLVLTLPMIAVLGAARPAQAGVTFSYAFRSTDALGNPIDSSNLAGGGLTFSFSSTAAAHNCNPITGAGCPVMDIVLIHDLIGLNLISTSVAYDLGLGLAVADAHPLVKKAANGVLSHPGGRGAVREVAEMLLVRLGRDLVY